MGEPAKVVAPVAETKKEATTTKEATSTSEKEKSGGALSGHGNSEIEKVTTTKEATTTKPKACSMHLSYAPGDKVSVRDLTGESSWTYAIEPALIHGLRLNAKTGEIHGMIDKHQKLGDFKYVMTETGDEDE